MGKLGSIILIAIAVAAFIFIAASTGGNVWTKGTLRFRFISVKVTAGLWKVCTTSCGSRGSDVPSWFNAVRAFAVISCLSIVAAVALSILTLFTEKIKGLFASIFFLGAAVCMILALVIFVAKVQSTPGGGLGWSYILGWVGVVTSGIGFIFGLLSNRF